MSEILNQLYNSLSNSGTKDQDSPSVSDNNTAPGSLSVDTCNTICIWSQHSIIHSIIHESSKNHPFYHPFYPVNDDNEFTDFNFYRPFGCGGNLIQGEQGRFSAQGSCLEQELILEQELLEQDEFLQELHSGQEPFSQVGGAGSNLTQSSGDGDRRRITWRSDRFRSNLQLYRDPVWGRRRGPMFLNILPPYSANYARSNED